MFEKRGYGSDGTSGPRCNNDRAIEGWKDLEEGAVAVEESERPENKGEAFPRTDSAEEDPPPPNSEEGGDTSIE